MKILTSSGLILLGSLAAFFSMRSEGAGEVRPVSKASHNYDSASRIEGPSYPHALWIGENFRTYVNEYNPRSFEFVLQESDPGIVGETLDYRESFRISTAFDVDQVVGAIGPYRWLISGHSQNGDRVIQEFRVTPSSGCYAPPELFLLPGGTVSTPPYVGTGGYIAQPNRKAIDSVQRNSLFRGAGLGQDILVSGDPYGRFVYVISLDQDSLYIIPSAGGAPVFAPTGTASHYLSDVSHVRVQLHVNEGLKLKCTLSDSNGVSYGYLMYSDYDEDGIWDSNEFMTVQQYNDFGYPGLWAADFIRGVDWLLPD